MHIFLILFFQWILPEIVAHGVITVLLLVHFQWIFFLFNAPLLGWLVYRQVFLSTKKRVHPSYFYRRTFKKDFKPGKMFEKLIFGGNILDVTSRRRIYAAIFCSGQVSKKCLFCPLEGQGLQVSTPPPLNLPRNFSSKEESQRQRVS